MTGGVLRGRSWRKRMRSAVVVVALLGLTLPIIVVLPFRWNPAADVGLHAEIQG